MAIKKSKKPIQSNKTKRTKKVTKPNKRMIIEKKKIRESLRIQEAEKKKKQAKVGDREELATGYRVLTNIGGRIVWLYKSDPGGEKQRQSQTKIVGLTRPKPIGLNQLDGGAIIRFKYRGDAAHDPQPLVLFLSIWKKLLHGIALKYMSTQQVSILRNIILATDPAIQDPLSFYNTRLKPVLNSFGNADTEPYRTYLVKNISTPQIYFISVDDLKR